MARSLVTAYRGDRVREMMPVITTMRHFAEVRVEAGEITSGRYTYTRWLASTGRREARDEIARDG